LELIIDLQDTKLMWKVFNQYRHSLTTPKQHVHYSIFLSADFGKLNSKENRIKNA